MNNVKPLFFYEYASNIVYVEKKVITEPKNSAYKQINHVCLTCADVKVDRCYYKRFVGNTYCETIAFFIPTSHIVCGKFYSEKSDWRTEEFDLSPRQINHELSKLELKLESKLIHPQLNSCQTNLTIL